MRRAIRGLSAENAIATLPAMNVPNLRSPVSQVGGLCYFARMIDKIRLHAAGQLPQEYHANLGGGFDERAVHFLWTEYPALVERVKQGGTDEEILAWAFAQGRKPSAEEIEIWNEFMRKRGWNDEATPILQRRLREGGFENRTDIQTMFDYIDLDEGRDPKK
jgi:gluconokinase